MVETTTPQYQQFGQRLTDRMKAADISIRTMSAELGVSYESVRKWTRGYALPEDHRRPMIAALLCTTVADLFAFADAGHRAEQPRSEFNVQMQRVRTHPWRIVSWVSAGLRSEAVEAYHPDDLPTEEFSAEPTREGYALVVKGDSMVREDGTGFPPGTVIAIEPRRKPKAGDYVVVRFTDTDEATFKQYVPDGPLKLLKPLNKAWPTQQLTPDAILCGVVVEARIIQRF